MANIVLLDRKKQCSVEEGWSILEQDNKSLALTKIDLEQVEIISTCGPGEHLIHTGSSRITRVREQEYILLDLHVGQFLFRNQHVIPKAWQKKGFIFFDGTILLDPFGQRNTRDLYYDAVRKEWGMGGSALSASSYSGYCSAVLKLQTK